MREELGVCGGRYPALTFEKLAGIVKIHCRGHGFSLLPSLYFISLPCVPWYIKQECFVKTSGLSDIFSFIFLSVDIEYSGKCQAHCFLVQQINCIILVVSGLTQIIS